MHLLLLHGAIGSSKQLQLLAEQLNENYTVHTLNFSGHGGNEIPHEDFSIELFANDVIKWMEENAFSKINIFGYSMGGYVALYLAKHHPEKIDKIFTLATKFNWSPEIAQQEIKLLNPEKISEKLPAFAESLAKRHAPADWKTVLSKTAAMMLNMGVKIPLTKSDFETINHQIILSIGDKDKMVSLEETEPVCRILKNSSLLVLPTTAHPIEQVDLNLLVNQLEKFFDK
jgi:esterase/lipase